MRRILLLVSCLTASAALAQNMPKPDLYLVHEETAKPSSMAGYESAGRDFLAALTEKKVYLIPGKEKEAEQVAKDYAALFKQKNMNDSWNLYQGLIGNDLPVFIVSIPVRMRRTSSPPTRALTTRSAPTSVRCRRARSLSPGVSSGERASSAPICRIPLRRARQNSVLVSAVLYGWAEGQSRRHRRTVG